MSEETPLSELISSIEQKDFSLPEEMENGGDTNPKKKKSSKAFLIIVSILLLLIVGVGGYYVYDNYIDKDEEIEEEEGLNPEESALEFGEVFIDLGEGKVLYVKAPTSSCDDTGFVSQPQETDNMLIYEDNQNKFCSDSHIISYFIDEESMTSYFSGGKAKYPLEEETIDYITYEYLLKEDYTEDSGAAHGLVYKKTPTVNVNGNGAFHLISYYKIAQEGVNTVIKGDYPKDDSTYTNFTKYCVFPLYQFGEEYESFLVFSGVASAGSEIDYCEMLNETEDFNIEIQQLGLL